MRTLLVAGLDSREKSCVSRSDVSAPASGAARMSAIDALVVERLAAPRCA
jgi:hypothetical protein